MTPLTIALIGTAASLLICLFVAAVTGWEESENPSAGERALNVIAGLAALWIFGVIYLLPTLIALHREVRQIGPIVLINIVFGWVFIGWFVAMAWALSSTRPLQVTHKRDRFER
jgi:hypothetical protein